MPYTAIAHYDTGSKIVDITKLNKARSVLAGIRLTCPECGRPMHARQSLAIRAHFAHNPTPQGSSDSDWNCSLSATNESAEHREAKYKVREFLQHHELYTDCTFHFEYNVEGVRRADLIALWPDGTAEVHEIQLSGISSQDLKARTLDYESRGFSVFWWLGEKANKDDNKHWLYGHCGQFGVIRTSSRFVSVHQD